MTVFSYVLVGAAVLVFIRNIRLRRAVKRLMENQAQIVADALGNSVTVDGIELPKPDDVRWESTKLSNGKYALKIGSVFALKEGYLFPANDIPSLDRTPATKNYCSAVWKAYHSRVARKAIETST